MRSRPECQRRNFEIIVGSIESKANKKRRFGLSQTSTNRPLECLRTNLKAAGWRDGTQMTVLSDGDPALENLFRFAMRVRDATIGGTREAAMAAVARNMELKTYLEYNHSAVANYAHRRRQGKAVSTSRAEGLVNDIANVRMGKKQRMRWSPRGAHPVATVRPPSSMEGFQPDNSQPLDPQSFSTPLTKAWLRLSCRCTV